MALPLPALCHSALPPPPVSCRNFPSFEMRVSFAASPSSLSPLSSSTIFCKEKKVEGQFIVRIRNPAPVALCVTDTTTGMADGGDNDQNNLIWKVEKLIRAFDGVENDKSILIWRAKILIRALDAFRGTF